MSEPVAKHRYFGESRNAFDLEEIERRMRESIEPPKPQPEQDPLAELARLVGQANNDAFSRIFSDQGGPSAPPPVSRLSEPPLSPPPRDHDQLYAAAFDPRPEGQARDPYAQDYPDEQQHGYAQDPARQGHGYAHGYETGHDAQGYAQGHDAYHDEAYDQHADWDGQYYQGQDAAYAQPYEAPRRPMRAKMLIGAALLVIAGGGAGAYMMRGPSGAGRDAPTILANPGPTKVQPAEQPSDGPKQAISILERGGSSGGSQSKLVQSEEQPVDVSATARVSGVRPARGPDAGAPVTLAPPPPPPVANSIFAEPKRVKAVAVRPDGTIIDPNAPAQPTPQRAEAPAPATPAPVPAARPNDIASLVASTTPSTTPGSAQKATPAPGPKTAARATEPKPAAKPASAPASTASIPAPTGAGGAFSVQLAGTTSAEEARDAVERLSRRYASELSGYRPAVVKAEVGSKTVYRVRVKGLSSDDANTLCARLKSGGGSCFVARD